jgi:hypothetical protein
LVGKFGCSATLRRPRSELLFTGRSSTTVVVCTPPTGRTHFTWPDAFSMMK